MASLVRHTIKKVFRGIYRSLPFKRPMLSLARASGMGRIIPECAKPYLSFCGPFEVPLEGRPFIMLNGYGRDIESTVFWHGIGAFEHETMRWWMALSKRSTYIFDIGANTGVYTLVARSLNSEAQIRAFEPLERIHKVLEENIKLNDNGNPPLAYRIALSDYSGIGEMFDLPVEHNYTASLNRNIHKERGQSLISIQESVSVMRLDEFLGQENIHGLDLIKMDVESHEPAVIRGMGESLRRFHPTMIVEIWNNEVGRAVEEALEGCQYSYYALVKGGPTQSKHIINDHPELGYVNYLVCTGIIADELGLARHA